jgi:hypothetical protein
MAAIAFYSMVDWDSDDGGLVSLRNDQSIAMVRLKGTPQ